VWLAPRSGLTKVGIGQMHRFARPARVNRGMIKDVNTVHLADPDRAFEEAPLAQKIVGSDLPSGVFLVEFADRQELSLPGIVTGELHVVDIEKDVRQVLVGISTKHRE